MNKLAILCVLLSVVSFGLTAVCNNPEISAVSFTTQDATVVTYIAFVAEFSLKCSNNLQTPNLYTELNGNIVPVAVIENKNYQISWIEDIKTARSGDRNIRLYDEDGYTAYRKALRAGESTGDVASLVTIVVSHPGAFQGPWLKSEFMAAALALFVAYIAFSSRSKLLS